MSGAHPPLTWGQVKAWAQDNEVQDGDEVRVALPHRELARIRDLSHYPAEDGEPAMLVLQERWG